MKPFVSFLMLLYCSVCLNVGCKDKVAISQAKPPQDSIYFGSFHDGYVVSLKATFSECGAWAGHTEEIVIHKDKKYRIHANYKRYPYNCDSLDYYYGNQNLKPRVDTTIILDKQEEALVMRYIQELSTASLLREFPGNAGD